MVAIGPWGLDAGRCTVYQESYVYVYVNSFF
jgi:hypothetical protein